jgi:hypothetical protein
MTVRSGVGDRRNMVSVKGVAKSGPALEAGSRATVDASGMYFTAEQQTTNGVPGLVNGHVKAIEFVRAHLSGEFFAGW